MPVEEASEVAFFAFEGAITCYGDSKDSEVLWKITNAIKQNCRNLHDFLNNFLKYILKFMNNACFGKFIEINIILNIKQKYYMA